MAVATRTVGKDPPELLEDSDSEEVVGGGIYGTVAVVDAWRLSRTDWKLNSATAEAVAWTDAGADGGRGRDK